ncbi:hypothetical protein BDR04DRAFT_1145326 [Suillus decipiens]|nr:hypothetical protein BDR04DRAFT_1145326 [Suillus decipiens]
MHQCRVNVFSIILSSEKTHQVALRRPCSFSSDNLPRFEIPQPHSPITASGFAIVLLFGDNTPLSRSHNQICQGLTGDRRRLLYLVYLSNGGILADSLNHGIGSTKGIFWRYDGFIAAPEYIRVNVFTFGANTASPKNNGPIIYDKGKSAHSLANDIALDNCPGSGQNLALIAAATNFNDKI